MKDSEIGNEYRRVVTLLLVGDIEEKINYIPEVGDELVIWGQRIRILRVYRDVTYIDSPYDAVATTELLFWGDSYSSTHTIAPSGTASNNSMTSASLNSTQPWELGVPSLLGWLVPWM